MTADLSLKNQFLLAMPGLAGSYFGDTLTLICEHNADGAMGLIVNRPSAVTLIELMAQLGIDKGATPPDRIVMEGGPVGGDRGFILHAEDDRFDNSLSLGNGMMLSSARQVLKAIAVNEGPADYLVALGYAGWDAGQLESEVADNAWLTCPADAAGELSRQIVFHTPFEQRVQRAAASLGIDFSLISSQAGHA
ncbi:MAG TPA: YqgE/AlgH family protein [Pseudomonadales bacterium]